MTTDAEVGNGITDVRGIAIGHHQRRGRGWRTGTTVVLVPDGAVGGVSVRGGGPGTRETDALAPGTLVDRIHAVCLSGGSAYGLAAAHGVMEHLAARDLGVRVGDEPGEVVPVVPAAVIFDLGRGGRFDARPDETFGRRAADRARAGGAVRGSIGAGTGAVAGGLQGGIGSASTRLGHVTVGALVVANPVGAVVDPARGVPWFEDGAWGAIRASASQRRELRAALAAPSESLNTTIGVIATDADLDVAEATALAAVGHDGIARAVRPAHSLFDGDTLFSLATGASPLGSAGSDRLGDPDGRQAWINRVFAAGADCVAAACVDAVLSAESHPGPPAGPPAYRDLVPEVRRASSTRRTTR